MREDLIIGLDVGSTYIRLVAGQRKNEELQIIGAIESLSEGISRGAINSIEDATTSISKCLEKAERLIGLPIVSALVGISGTHIKAEKSRGVVAVSRSDGEITEDDVERAIEAARALSVPPNYEILHVIPTKYSVDNQTDIKDPVGMIGVRLEVETLIIQGLSAQIKNFTKAIYRTELNIEDLVLASLAASEAVLNGKQKELGAVLINIGSSVTNVAVFEEGELLHVAALPIGSEHITADIAIGLRCPINLAERVKIEHGTVLTKDLTKKDEIDISDLVKEEELGDDQEIISKKYVAEIIEARAEEIMEKVDEELKKIDRSGMLPAGAFLIGGGAKLPGIVEVAKKKLRLPASLGVNRSLASTIDKVNDPAFLVALGLVIWGDQTAKGGGSSWKKLVGGKLISGAIGKVGGWFKKLKP
ncbi:cell division protein FtsA [Candidatus Falkowbacteria bacterium CG10_big_fil_rev_8_21_14_0_10_43_11]|uniref:Cell division protein FtsA n=1 Tax=Candidatus Falkowbacteria bacterium CG10_big_fil_rev_8_21_14_0_10_43_11 TaxID=1974568 RepID=A0A2M6WM58_9BACT|nr:MAG: cell division protein FtsA [Candidatus Falkowbacteria bacterium CG10_big_fil_rev_8_21_14_0_10_43_11]